MHYINGDWHTGTGAEFTSVNPSTGAVLWKGNTATASEVNDAVEAARKAFSDWKKQPVEQRLVYLNRYQEILERRQNELARLISEEVGKPLWESSTEVQSMIAKVSLTAHALSARRSQTRSEIPGGYAVTDYRPLGVVVVLGPFNFPGHIPSGQILPALLAGNTVVLKPSEQAPKVAEAMINIWVEAGLPKGVIGLLQGGKSVGEDLIANQNIDAVFFTGSYATGVALQKSLASRPQVLLALELGGNNPLVVHAVEDQKSAIYWTVLSAFLTAGQRCTCAQRLIVTGDSADFLGKLVETVKGLKIDRPDADPQPFYSALIHATAAKRVLDLQTRLLKSGAIALLEASQLELGGSFLSPGILDITECKSVDDDEVFGPLLYVKRVDNLDEAIQEANNTDYGLVAAIFTDVKEDFEKFSDDVRAGLINWNRPTTGAGGQLPFGGVGKSGNHRPAGYFMIDACNAPVAMIQSEKLNLPEVLSPGIKIQ